MTNAFSVSLIDTNVAVYAYDPSDPWKQQRAVAVLERLAAPGWGAMSVQCLNEFYAVATRPGKLAMAHEEARRCVLLLRNRFRVLDLTPATTTLALDGVRAGQFSWWDALVWASARLHGIPRVISEDFNAGAVVDGVTFVNPFDPAFDMARFT